MKINYSYTFNYPRQMVWKYIQDENVLRQSLPGCKSFKKVEERDVYLAELGISVGPIKGLFHGEVRQIDQKEPGFYRLMLKGKGKPGEIDATADMYLDEVEDGVKVSCEADSQVTGILASAGQRVMNGVAKMVISQFFKEIDKELAKGVERAK